MVKRSLISIGVLGVFAASFIGGCSAISEDGQWQDSGEPPSEAGVSADGAEDVALHQEALTGTHKLCSFFVPNKWRDSIVVPTNWSRNSCASFATEAGATMMQIGCVFDSGFSNSTALSVTVPGNLLDPSPNCQW